LADVGGARGQGVAAQVRDRGVQAEGLLGVVLVPLVTAVRAHQRPGADRVVDVGAAAARALVQAVVAAGAGVDDAVAGMARCRPGSAGDLLVPEHGAGPGLLTGLVLGSGGAVLGAGRRPRR